MNQIVNPRSPQQQRFLLTDEDGVQWLSTLLHVDAEGYWFYVEDAGIEVLLSEETLEDMFDRNAAVQIQKVPS